MSKSKEEDLNKLLAIPVFALHRSHSAPKNESITRVFQRILLGKLREDVNNKHDDYKC